MARSNYIRRIPARFHLMWGIWGISVYKRRVAKGGGGEGGGGIGF
jgi:hypothetical protein